MGYQALLFCPDEKTARTVTQVLSELGFSVEACTETFAAVKKLMGQHFDAIVVDCENEQNATLLFKSAHSSASNQSSLAVAVVEGQAGVAKAFRIGANLVLTKPINVEQAKGTLRVARGLLRKGDAARAAVPANTVPPAAKNTGAEVNPTLSAKSAPPASIAGAATAHPFASATASTPAPLANSIPAADDPDLLEIGTEESPPGAGLDASRRAPAAFEKPGQPVSKDRPWVQLVAQAPASPANSVGSGSSAATASAPARVPQASEVEGAMPSKAPAEPTKVLEKTVNLAKDEAGDPAATAVVPAFTFGGNNADAEPAGRGRKKALIGAAALILVSAGVYAAWTQFQNKASVPTVTPAATPNKAAPAPAAAPPAAQPSNRQPVTPSTPAPSSTSVDSTDAPTALQPSSVTDNIKRTPGKSTPAPSANPSNKASSSALSSADKPESVAKPAEHAIVVKNNSAPRVQRKLATPDAPAPGIIGIAPAQSGGTLSNLIPNEGNSPKPVLQTLKISQGVSQGLLLKKVQPTYPSTALHMRVEGSVQLLATIGKSGSITAVKVISGEPVLAQAALAAVKQWKYKPYYLNGDPVEIQTEVTINFKLPR